jgi:hypothetical protein
VGAGSLDSRLRIFQSFASQLTLNVKALSRLIEGKLLVQDRFADCRVFEPAMLLANGEPVSIMSKARSVPKATPT